MACWITCFGCSGITVVGGIQILWTGFGGGSPWVARRGARPPPPASFLNFMLGDASGVTGITLGRGLMTTGAWNVSRNKNAMASAWITREYRAAGLRMLKILHVVCQRRGNLESALISGNERACRGTGVKENYNWACLQLLPCGAG